MYIIEVSDGNREYKWLHKDYSHYFFQMKSHGVSTSVYLDDAVFFHFAQQEHCVSSILPHPATQMSGYISDDFDKGILFIESSETKEF